MPLARSLLDRSSGTVSGGEAATAHLGRAASAAFDAGSPCVGRPESIKLKGPPLRPAQWGTKENGGTKALPLGEDKSAAFGRKNKLGPLRGKRWCGSAANQLGRPVRGIISAWKRFFRRTPRFYTNLTEFYSGFTETKRRS